uniref:Uncharacterized protein n=1 Tax=Setaria viridis TaxID=4556 RepID=A0A4U6VXQ6_SETVI|nr:hypothetical protein SEVIR_2G296866v2 [Setaria viridis]
MRHQLLRPCPCLPQAMCALVLLDFLASSYASASRTDVCRRRLGE